MLGMLHKRIVLWISSARVAVGDNMDAAGRNASINWLHMNDVTCPFCYFERKCTLRFYM